MNKFDAATLARNIRVRRAELGITQRDLAELAGINIASVCAYENGTRIPGAKSLMALCGVLDRDPSSLLGWQ